MRGSINPSDFGNAKIAFQNGGHKIDPLKVKARASGEVSCVGWVGPNPASVVKPDNLGAILKGEVCNSGADSLYDSLSCEHGDHLYVSGGSVEWGDWPF